MKFQVTFTGTWNDEIEADSREEAEEIVHKQSDRWWDLNYDRQMKLKESRNA